MIYIPISPLEDHMTAVQDQINALIAKVQAENTVIGSAMTLITGLKAQIAALQTSSPPPAAIDPAALQALSDAIDAGAAQLAAAVASTPVKVTMASTTAPTTVTAPSS